MNKSPIWTFSMVDETRKQQYVNDLKQFEIEMSKLHLPIYLIYGTLLGAIREKDFIPHDSDIDVAYLSNFHTRDEVFKERAMVKQYLQNHKMLRTTKTIGFKIKYLSSKFDVWTSWTENNGYYILPYSRICSSNLILPFKQIKFKNKLFSIPIKSTQLLDILYITWQTPITKNKHFRKLG